ncbi:hypothetical protein CORC01_14287 [Colletotrichum orchidophilum]|uniref:Uncharacterized protein n=1 Tax=Colletotrichum orchidophilum TaxID=1209926 RepID=A0A1G4AMK0_9PEZI|nr:uncharacterized protein CORC01_14287 [Colletotrichum orchidophilum]OHE90410.1 hypothetical protein CORC01_14287 [Colletotrichum orchidophilum]
MVLATSRDEGDRARCAALRPATRSRSRLPSRIHQTEVIWDEPSQPKRQRVRWLKIRLSVDLRRSHGIVLTCDDSNKSRRLGYFKFLHEGVIGVGFTRKEAEKFLSLKNPLVDRVQAQTEDASL